MPRDGLKRRRSDPEEDAGEQEAQPKRTRSSRSVARNKAPVPAEAAAAGPEPVARKRKPAVPKSKPGSSKARPALGRRFVDDKSPFSLGPKLERGTEWPHHEDSDDSDAYETTPAPPKGSLRLYRALREDEEPLKAGLKPVAPREKSRTLAKHVQGGGKSRYISLTSNKRKAVKWSLKTKKNHPPRVVTLNIPEKTPLADFSFEDTARRTGLGNTGKNFARSSSEVAIEGTILKGWVVAVERVEPVPKSKLKKAAKPELPRISTREHTGLAKNQKKPLQYSLNPEEL